MENYAAAQYQLIQSARTVLLTYCATLTPAHFVAAVPGFPQRSMRSLLVHVAGTYQHWLGAVGLQRHLALPQPEAFPALATVRELFAEADALVAEFIREWTAAWQTETVWPLPNRSATLACSPLQLFTHATTHEFHHKGQLLTMSRLLGYTPVDTDVIRT